MFNQTDTPQSSNLDNGKSRTIPGSITENPGSFVDDKTFDDNSNLSLPQRFTKAFKRLSLTTKATVLAIAIGTIPVLGIGILAYSLANKSMTAKISQIQQAEAQGLADKVNRFMVERYADIQTLANLRILTNNKVKSAITNTEKQEQLEQFIQSYKVYDSIAVFDLQGNPILQTQGDTLGNHSDREYFQAAKNSNRPYISQPEVSKSSQNISIYLAAPVKDSVTRETIAIVRARMPVQSLDDIVKNYAQNQQEYHLIDSRGNFFLATEKQQIGRSAIQDFPGLDNLVKAKKEETFVTVDKSDGKKQLVSYVDRKLDGLPDLQWQVILARDTDNAFSAQSQLLWAIALGTGLTTISVAAIAAWLARKATQPILNATAAVVKLGEGELSTRIELDSEDEIGLLSENINHMAQQLQVLIAEQEQEAEQVKCIADMTLRIRRSLQADDIYQTSVREIRTLLKTDRVIVYKLDPETWEGVVVAESVSVNFPKILGAEIYDPCFREKHLEAYQNKQVRAISNIYEEHNLSNAECYIQILEQFAVKANLVAPILFREQLLGLLIAHHCDSPRIWQPSEIEVFKQLAIQIGYAIEQAKLLEEVEAARQIAEKSSVDERQQKEALQMQLLELLSNVEGAASGDLTVRADVTTGEIGTVADFFNSIVESLRDIVTQVKFTATQVNQAVGSNSEAIRQLAETALNQANEINYTLDAVEQMSKSMTAIAHNAEQAAEVARNASTTANQSGQAMDLTVQNIVHLRSTVGETAKKVKRLGESTQQISRVVALINQISMQTNLLAINAGIEAARAGEEGQGFAVVAEEVGELAARSAAATKEIEQIVENIQRETTDVVQAMEVGVAQVVEGTRIVEDAKSSLSQILDVSRQIDDLVQSISLATNQGVETSQIVSKLMQQIAENSQYTSASSHQVSESLQETVDISRQLQDVVGTFKVS
ncbi:methyl-accepting chemotaxis protein [Calothrix sp. 336/3]|uniref:methyl-accepting chemotaxis protein n=1 Tax=Calothrix sp. 336/3 TaxID=1337936 RepID=UPI0004E2E2C1|nr:methyl-accepting chemotaxis protein [Calothrix sp. 336/3]AKG22859.1 chemotaxis protein [Calothrix sp. 336/3]